MDDLAVKAIIAATVLLLAAGIVEKVFHRRALRAVPVRILVNGTRGKTSVTRLIAAILREAGVRTWAKATGTQAVYILPDGTEREYRKRRPVNIREQVPFFRSAAPRWCAGRRGRVHGAAPREPADDGGGTGAPHHRRAHQRPRRPRGRDWPHRG